MSDYIDNKKLTKELGDWSFRVRNQIKNGEKPDRITEYIGECILLICNNMGYNRKFINYTYKDFMISDAIEYCVRYVKNFDIEKSNNAFGYISTIAYWAFVGRIKKENKRHIDHLLYIRKIFTEDEIKNVLDNDIPSDIKNYDTYIDHMQSVLDDMNVEIPDVPVKKKKKRKKTELEKIMTGEKY